MTPEPEEGIDKQRVLSEIDGASAAAPVPEPAPAPPLEGPLPPPPVPAPAWNPRASRRRNRAAALVLAVVGVIWLASGLGMKTLLPCLVGLGFIGGAVAVWVVAVWDGD